MGVIELVDCARCKRKHSAKSAVCPFCGLKREGGPAMPPAPRTLEEADRMLLRTCPNCRAQADLVPIPVQGWQDEGTNWRGNQQWMVQSGQVPGYCEGCSRGLLRARLYAGLAAMAPILFLAMVVGMSRRVPAVSLGMGFFYSLYLLRWGGYTWADDWMWGRALADKISVTIPSFRGQDKIRFPGGILQVLIRFGFWVAAVGLGILLGSLFR